MNATNKQILLEKALLLKQLYLKKICGESYCQDFTPPKPIISEKSKLNLTQIIESCTLCELSKSADKKICGSIVPNANICFITLKPILPYSVSFEMIENIAKGVFSVESYSLLSLIKCVTHIPCKQSHIATCGDFLKTQIKEMDSQLFVIFGEEVAQFLLENDEKLESLRGRILTNIKNFIVTFHTSDLLKNHNLKKLALEDFKIAKDYINQRKKGKQ